MNSLLRLVNDILLEIYIEKTPEYNQDFDPNDIIPSFYQLKEFYKELGIVKQNFKCMVYEFKRYNAFDHIDNEELCENYLDFCAKFELENSPAILIDITFCNRNHRIIKINSSTIAQHKEDLNELIKNEIIISISTFFN